MVNFKNTVIILTSNIGSATILESMSRGDFEAMKSTVTQQVRGGGRALGWLAGWVWPRCPGLFHLSGRAWVVAR